jgi:antitoxin (DNA-binding transcriptional repressor) of toxin-antitoxin stability system
MKRVNVLEIWRRLSHYLRRVERRESIEIVTRPAPIERRTSSAGEARDPLPQVERLIRAGLLTRPKRAPGREVLDFEPIRCRVDAVQIVVDGRGAR